MKIIPSTLESVPSHAKANNSRETNIRTGQSCLTDFAGTGMGKIRAVIARTSRILEILLPTTFPIAISGKPFKAAWILTSNSGAEVPKATTVKPMIMVGIFKRRAITTLLSTRYFPLIKSRTSPNNRRR